MLFSLSQKLFYNNRLFKTGYYIFGEFLKIESEKPSRIGEEEIRKALSLM
jgi:hypothetical protein